MVAGPAFGLGLGLGCGSKQDEHARPGTDPAPVDWTDRLEDAEPGDILAALAQSHATIRRSVGPHRLHYTSSLSIADPSQAGAEETEEEAEEPNEGGEEAADDVEAGEPAEPDPVEAEEGEPVVVDQAVDDVVTLVWGVSDDEGPRFSLEQHNDKDRGRDVVVADGQLFAKLEHRAWTRHGLETDVYESWLDEAQQAPHGLLEFASSRLAMQSEVRSGAGLGGTDAIAVELKLGSEASEDANSTSKVAPNLRAWRERATLESLEGHLLLDATSGAWLEIEISLTFGLKGADGRALRGSAKLSGTVEPLEDGAARVEPPAEPEPLPERVRYEQERRLLLDGLAAP